MAALTDDLFDRTGPAVITDPPSQVDCDVVIVGSGVGGATLAWALRDSGARVLVLERGDFLPRERQNWSSRSVQYDGRYRNSDPWIGPDGQAVLPDAYHYVGGASKLYGASMHRLRESDFEDVRMEDGLSPAWPVDYAEFEPYYGRAEELYRVHGDDSDPTSPWRSTPYPYAAVRHEGPIDAIAGKLERQKLNPYSLPIAVDSRDGGSCVLCRTCDAFPCMVDAKGDADVSAMRPALSSPTVRLMTNAEVRSISVSADGSSVRHLEVAHARGMVRVTANRYVVAAGAVNTAALLLRSRTPDLPDGVANGSGMVGRNYMAHVITFIVGFRPGRAHEIVFQKTLGINDWYHAGPDNDYPLGNVQAIGKAQGWTFKTHARMVPHGMLEWVSQRSVEFLAESEDLPLPDSRVTVDEAGRVHLAWKPTNLSSHRELVRRTTRALRRCGYPVTLTETVPWSSPAHQCGTAKMGEDPAQSVVGTDGRTHDVDNLWITDASVFPSSSAVNPALTVAANALRVAALGDLTR